MKFLILCLFFLNLSCQQSSRRTFINSSSLVTDQGLSVQGDNNQADRLVRGKLGKFFHYNESEISDYTEILNDYSEMVGDIFQVSDQGTYKQPKARIYFEFSQKIPHPEYCKDQTHLKNLPSLILYAVEDKYIKEEIDNLYILELPLLEKDINQDNIISLSFSYFDKEVVFEGFDSGGLFEGGSNGNSGSAFFPGKDIDWDIAFEIPSEDIFDYCNQSAKAQ